MKRSLTFLAVLSVALVSSLSANAQTTAAQNTANGAVGTAANTVNGAVNTAGNTVNGAVNGVNGTVGTVGNTAQGVVGSLQPTLQPVTQGVGGALDNLTQPQTVSSLLDFLAGVIPNHIEAHVNLDSLRVDKLTVDVRGVDLRDLRVDLLVANSRNAGTVKPALPAAGSNPNGATSGSTNTALPGNTPIAGSSARPQ